MKVFVVWGEFGEYDQSGYGLCGVFSSKEAAISHSEFLKAGKAAYRSWHDAFCTEVDKRRPPMGTPFDSEKHGLIVAEARKHVPTEPKYFTAERFEVVEMSVDEPVDFLGVYPD